MEREIANIITYKFIPKVGKYIVKLGFHGSHAIEVWMTERQLDQTQLCFSETARGYSSNAISIVGVWNENGYYAYSKVERHKEERVFRLPTQYDLSDLEDI